MGISYYYAVVPVGVLRDQLLKPIERVIYAEITSHIGTGKYGILDMEKLCGLYGCTEGTMQSYLSSLEKRGYIKTEHYKDMLKVSIK